MVIEMKCEEPVTLSYEQWAKNDWIKLIHMQPNYFYSIFTLGVYKNYNHVYSFRHLYLYLYPSSAMYGDSQTNYCCSLEVGCWLISKKNIWFVHVTVSYHFRRGLFVYFIQNVLYNKCAQDNDCNFNKTHNFINRQFTKSLLFVINHICFLFKTKRVR